MTHITNDIPAFMIVSGRPATVRSINAIGLERRGFDKDTIGDLREAFKIIYKRKYSLQEAVDQLKAMREGCESLQILIDSLESSEKGIHPLNRKHFAAVKKMSDHYRFGIVAGEKSEISSAHH